MQPQPIETAPRDGTPVFVSNAQYGRHLLAWSEKRKRWEGKEFAVARMVNTWWGLEFEQPTHWEPVTTPAPANTPVIAPLQPGN